MTTDSRTSSIPEAREPDIRIVDVDITRTYTIDVSKFFEEFASEWAEAQAEGDDEEDFISETIAILAQEDSLHIGAIDWHEDIDHTTTRKGA